MKAGALPCSCPMYSTNNYLNFANIYITVFESNVVCPHICLFALQICVEALLTVLTEATPCGKIKCEDLLLFCQLSIELNSPEPPSLLLNLFGRHNARDSWLWMSDDSMQFTKWPQDPDPRLTLWSGGEQRAPPMGGPVLRVGGLHLTSCMCAHTVLHNTFTSSFCPLGTADTARRVYFYSTRKVLT